MWMLYGAYGFSGTLIAEEAVRRGHHPLLAGRDESKLKPLAARLGLDYRVFALDGPIAPHLEDVDLVFHAAGPHLFTSDPMIRACTLTGTHYLDITGEIPVFENSYTHDEAAQQAGCAIVCGVGFDVVPTNCLAQYVADQVPGAAHLEIAVNGMTHISSGTAKTSIAAGSTGGWIRKDGTLTPYPLGAGMKKLRFSHGERSAMPVPWGDLAASYRSTGIPNITAYMVFPGYVAPLARITAPIGQALLSSKRVRAGLNKLAEILFKGPSEAHRTQSKAYMWAQASDGNGHSAGAWLETPEPYQLTALAGVRAVERTLADNPAGALAPAQAFGADFVLDIEGVRRFDTI